MKLKLKIIAITWTIAMFLTAPAAYALNSNALEVARQMKERTDSTIDIAKKQPGHSTLILWRRQLYLTIKRIRSKQIPTTTATIHGIRSCLFPFSELCSGCSFRQRSLF